MQDRRNQHQDQRDATISSADSEPAIRHDQLEAGA